MPSSIGIGLIALLLLQVPGFTLLYGWAVRHDRRHAQRERASARADDPGERCWCVAVSAPCKKCEPEREISLGVIYHEAGETLPRRALIEVERTKPDQVTIYLLPNDGSDSSSIHMSRATAEALGVVMGRAPLQEVRWDGDEDSE